MFPCPMLRYVLMSVVAVPMSAGAATYAYTADTANPVLKQGMVAASGINWKCGGNQCTTSGPWPTPGVSACNALARQVGTIKYYGHPKKSLNPSELAQCNVGAAVAQKPAGNIAMSKPPSFLKPAPLPSPTPGDIPKPGGFAPAPKPGGFVPIPKPGGFVPPLKPAASADGKDKSLSAVGQKKGGFLPSSQNSFQNSSPPKSAGETKPAARSSGPFSFTADRFTVTGTGALNSRLPFTARTFTTDRLTVTGTGALVTRSVGPATFTTDRFTVTGTGVLH